MKKIYRITHSKFGIMIFPTPVEKKSMFLIQAPSIEHAELYKYLLDFGALADPLKSPSLYEKRGIHTDGVTDIFDLKWSDLQLELLPQRELDLNRAHILEKLFSKKFEALFQKMDQRSELIKDIQFRFSKQQQCSECQKLGIGSLELEAWFNGLSRWA
jgi:hypothetical protein